MIKTIYMAKTQLVRTDMDKTIGQRKKKTFSKYKKAKLDYPNLFEGQLDSFKELIDTRLEQVFEEFSSISDYSEKKFELKFGKIVFEEPKLSAKEARENRLTYEAPMKIRATLVNKTLGTEKEQEIFLADFPLMTKHGTFIINGVERVIVPQLARSYGILFTKQILRGRYQFGSKVIPSRGAWKQTQTILFISELIETENSQ
jgi:DNA-directed RNA polymerase subunit beta